MTQLQKITDRIITTVEALAEKGKATKKQLDLLEDLKRDRANNNAESIVKEYINKSIRGLQINKQQLKSVLNRFNVEYKKELERCCNFKYLALDDCFQYLEHFIRMTPTNENHETYNTGQRLTDYTQQQLHENALSVCG